MQQQLERHYIVTIEHAESRADPFREPVAASDNNSLSTWVRAIGLNGVGVAQAVSGAN